MVNIYVDLQNEHRTMGGNWQNIKLEVCLDAASE